MSLELSINKYAELFAQVGRSGVSTLFPKEFEVYLMAIELTDSENNTIDYFSFPVMPESISKSEPLRNNLKKTSSGITLLSSNSFAPQTIQIKGNFGRSFKFYLSPKAPDVQGVAYSTTSGIYNLWQTKGNNTFSANISGFVAGIKTGFGALSILKSIVNKSNGVDASGKPFKVYFYNFALSESYLVSIRPNGIDLSQSTDKNMIWGYNLSMDIISPLEALSLEKKKTSLLELASFNAIQGGINSFSSSLASSL